MSEAKKWGVRDTSGFFGPEPFLAATEKEAQAIAANDSFAVVVRREREGSPWVVVPR